MHLRMKMIFQDLWVLTYLDPALNKTNCKTIEKLSGTPDIEQWPGIGIILCVQRVMAFGELVEAVRVRPVKPFVCSDCGGIITGFKDRTHAEIRDHTRKEYGRQLCAACATKARDLRNKNVQTNKNGSLLTAGDVASPSLTSSTIRDTTSDNTLFDNDQSVKQTEEYSHRRRRRAES